MHRIQGASRLDLKIAIRMLLRQPGLTLVAIFALAIGIPIGLLPLHVLDRLQTPMPVENGSDIVMVSNYDRAQQGVIDRPLHDFAQWRTELSSFESLAMWRTDPYNVNSDDGRAAPVQGAEVNASMFAMLRVPPLFGRPLNDADEAIGAPDVVVIGYDLWQNRLAADPNVLGTTIRISGVPHTVVGVMPEGFKFPYNDNLWMPMRYDVRAFERGAGPSAMVMARLANGVTIDEAQNELATFGLRMAAQYPETHAQLQPQVRPYTRVLTQIDNPEAKPIIYLIEVLALLLLVLACGNVGVLILARVATREGEIAIRTALGASRSRIVSQLFIECLLLAVLGAGAGLLMLQAFARGPDFVSSGLPAWVSLDVSMRTTLLALSLAVMSAVIAGVIPALKATGKSLQSSMMRASGSGIRFGKGYSALIMSEVAVALLFLVLGWSLLPAAVKEPAQLGIQSDQFLHAEVNIPRVNSAEGGVPLDQPDLMRRVAVLHNELIRRLPAEPGLGPVAIANAFPGMSSHATPWIEVEGFPMPPGSRTPGYKVNVARVDIGFFDAIGQQILRGRNFNNGDTGDDRSAVIVNTSFVERVMGNRNPIGQRIRYWEPDGKQGPWLQIVGVVERLGMNSLDPAKDEGMYLAAAPGELHPVSFVVRAGSNPEQFTPRLRALVASIDAGALIDNAMPLSEVPNPDRRILMLSTYLIALIAGIAMLLSNACLYALMSFTVAKRTRECAIRTALGARPTNIITEIGSRVFRQLSIGALIGAALSAAMLALFSTLLAGGSVRTTSWPLTVAVITIFVMVVGVLACVKPTLRLIRIKPAEVLKG